MTNLTELKRLAESRKAAGWRSMDSVEIETILALIAENERLRGDVRMLVRQHMPLQALEGMEGWSEVVEAREAVEQRDQLRAEVEALRKDAERYRWIRKNNGDDGLCELCIPQGYSWIPFSDMDGESLDMAIDTAMVHQ